MPVDAWLPFVVGFAAVVVIWGTLPQPQVHDFVVPHLRAPDTVQKQGSTVPQQCKTDTLTFWSPFVCYNSSVLAILSFGQQFEITNEAIDDWEMLKAIVCVRPPTQVQLIERMSELKYLSYMTLDSCVSGTLPPTLWEMSQLEILTVANGRLTGTVTSAITQLTNLKTLILSALGIEGSLPQTWAKLSNLAKLRLDGNSLVGTLPTTLSDLTQLSILDLSANSFVGTIPSHVGLLAGLTELVFATNAFSGTIPTQLGALRNVTILNLSNNRLQGTIPTELGQMTQLSKLFLNSNRLQGTIPTELVRLTGLVEFSVGDNNLEGTLPSEFQQITRCDYSGLSSSRCAEICTCPLTHFEFRHCNDQGGGQICIAGVYFLPLLLVYFGLIAVSLTQLLPRDLSRKQIAIEAMLSACAVAGFVSRAYFVLAVDDTELAISSGVLLACGGLVSVVISVLSISSRAAKIDPTTLTYKHEAFRRRVFDSTIFFSLAVTFCALNLRVLPIILGQKKTFGSRSAFRFRIDLVVVLLGDVPQLVLQCIALSMGDHKFYVLLSLGLTLLLLVLELAGYLPWVLQHFAPNLHLPRRASKNPQKSQVPQ